MKVLKWGKALAVAAAFTMFAVPASAQDDDGGPMTQGDDAKYISVTHIKFKPGKRERAMEIISEHFAKAGAAAGTPPPMLAIHYQTGKWDASYVWHMEGGMADLEWYRSANDVAWWAAMVELAGGEEEAGAIMAERSSTIADAQTEVGHFHAPTDDE
jgi:hypothetical protein